MKCIDVTTEEARTVQILRALANPVRFRIVTLLAERNACMCGDLVVELPVAQSTVSEHLKVLKDAGIVQGVIAGPNRCYCLEPGALEWLRARIPAIQTEPELITPTEWRRPTHAQN